MSIFMKHGGPKAVVSVEERRDFIQAMTAAWEERPKRVLLLPKTIHHTFNG